MKNKITILQNNILNYSPEEEKTVNLFLLASLSYANEYPAEIVNMMWITLTYSTKEIYLEFSYVKDKATHLK